jgi:hypothetical protein
MQLEATDLLPQKKKEAIDLQKFKKRNQILPLILDIRCFGFMKQMY